MRTCLFVVLLVAVSPALAQELPDSGLPDASVGQGGADQTSEENDGQGGPCLTAKDCDAKFTCENQRCVPAKTMDLGCNAAPVGFLGALGALLLSRSVRAKTAKGPRFGRS